MLAMDWFGNETLHNTPFTNMTIDDNPVAAIQNVDNFSFACVKFCSLFFSKKRLTESFRMDDNYVHSRVFQAGHEIVSVHV